MLKPRYIMIGGFLGAGKTTAIAQIAQRFHQRNLRVGLITNDQSTGLVDTAMLRTTGFPTEEITGGCFCCKFNSLVDAAEQLTKDAQPEVFIAEPVGSCTDLKATVAYPLSQMFGDNYAIAPLSVMVDPVRAARVFGLEQGKSFSEKVIYIYRKQLEEADIIVINKRDLLTDAQFQALQERLRNEFSAVVIGISARSGEGLETWMELIETKAWQVQDAMEVDYDVYADGEALLGWLNGTYRVKSETEFDGNALIQSLGDAIREFVENASGEIAHLKMTLVPEVGNDVAIGNIVRGETCDLSYELREPLCAGQLLLNLRAECDPELLRRLSTKLCRTPPRISR